jgi:3,5-dihydroxyphenylacetyl-CoA synthase
MFITGLGTATPSQRYTQKECWETLKGTESYAGLSSRSQAIVRKVLLGKNGIETRHLALADLKEAFQLDPDALHLRYMRNAPALSAQAAFRALEQAGLDREEIDAVIISTCTGYTCPGLTSYVAEQLGLRPDVLLLDLVGQGCGAAIPNWRMAEALLAAGRCEHVLSICVEICSAAFYLDDDPGVLISACLFGDGAGAAVLSAGPRPRNRQVRWKACHTALSTEDRDCLRLEQKNGMLRNILGLHVPGLAGKYAELVFSELLRQENLNCEQIGAWILHAGGREILNSLRDRLKLEEKDLQWSAEILRCHGNLSSACVLFVLEKALQANAPGGLWWMTSFGAGFSCHGAILEVEG